MMKLELRKIYEAADANAGLGGGAGGVAKDFDYSQVEAALTKIEANIANILTACGTKISVTSYTGDAQAAVEGAVNKIPTYLATMETPLKELSSKIVEVKEAYAKSEAGIKAALSNIGNGGSNGGASNSNNVNMVK